MEQELDRLQEQEIITPVPFSDWAATSVPIVKPSPWAAPIISIVKLEAHVHYKVRGLQVNHQQGIPDRDLSASAN